MSLGAWSTRTCLILILVFARQPSQHLNKTLFPGLTKCESGFFPAHLLHFRPLEGIAPSFGLRRPGFLHCTRTVLRLGEILGLESARSTTTSPDGAPRKSAAVTLSTSSGGLGMNDARVGAWSEAKRGGSRGLCTVEASGPRSRLEWSSGGNANGDRCSTSTPERKCYSRSVAT